MNLDAFTSFVLKMVDNEYPVREVPISYNLSMRLQVNEIKGDRIFNMTFPEFIEAYCRVIDRFSPVPHGESSLGWAMQDRIDQLLNVKLENVMPALIKCISHPDFKLLKDKFVHPIKDDIGILKFDPSGQFYASIWPCK
jgi:hypothetical protein